MKVKCFTVISEVYLAEMNKSVNVMLFSFFQNGVDATN